MGGRSRAPRVARLGRFIRGRRPDRNPLRRASDLAETGVLAILVTAFCAAAPFAATASGSWAHAAAHRTQLAQRASWHEVPAVLLKAAPGSGLNDGYPLSSTAPARWKAPDGRTVTGEVSVTPGTPRGATVTIWITRDGQVTDPPLTDSQVAGQAILAGGLAVAGLGAGTALIGVLARRELDKRRMAAWDADWEETEPRWTTRA